MLTIKQIEAAKPKDKSYRLADSGGLFLFISKGGGKIWRFRYRKNGKEQTYVIGAYPDISLLDARKLHAKAKSTLANGGELEQKEKKDPELVVNFVTFETVFKEWYEFKKDTWSEGYRKEMLSMFDNDILPIIGNEDVASIDPLKIVDVIRHFESRGAMERASKARRRCGEVFRYAVITGRSKYNPAPDLADAEKGYEKKHYPFLIVSEIPAFNKALSTYSGSIISKIATQVLQYTGARTVEMRTMKWCNVDFDEQVINIDQSVMKGRRKHLIPMSSQVIALMKQIEPITRPLSEYVFAGRNDRRKPISENAVLSVIKRIGYDGIASGHGFRHQMSTILYDSDLFDSKWIEKQLAHVDKNSIRGIYNHAEYLEKRRKMMQWFADYIDEISK
ncbi:tyrosine-type recombinase/integrase [Providencia manganoxydans]|uniref:tyrosine-type recombinase/integrase n=1 Tax=Providencia manganoxydans TaxID=2923283 RepID=UPI0032DAB03D